MPSLHDLHCQRMVPSEGKSRIEVILDFDQYVQVHVASGEVKIIGNEFRLVFGISRVGSVNEEPLFASLLFQGQIWLEFLNVIYVFDSSDGLSDLR
jgi:hypothetical protein